jgi:putative polyhydroxyalkanoate system protein
MMRIDRNHAFSVEEARSRLEALTTYWQTKYGIKPEWSGNTLRCKGSVKGIDFDAKMDIAEKLVKCEAEVGWLAERLGARAYIEKKLAEYLDASKPVATLPRG